MTEFPKQRTWWKQCTVHKTNSIKLSWKWCVKLCETIVARARAKWNTRLLVSESVRLRPTRPFLFFAVFCAFGEQALLYFMCGYVHVPIFNCELSVSVCFARSHFKSLASQQRHFLFCVLLSLASWFIIGVLFTSRCSASHKIAVLMQPPPSCLPFHSALVFFAGNAFGFYAQYATYCIRRCVT